MSASTSRAQRRTGYLGLGSNVGDRLRQLRAARDALPARGLEVTGSSSVYETEPIGEVTEQRDFLNACVRVQTELEPAAVLAACKAIERGLGRVAGGPRHGPRPIDLDVLLLGDLEVRNPELNLPHPEITTRRFVLLPLLELDPELRLPNGTAVADAVRNVEGQRVERVGEL